MTGVLQTNGGHVICDWWDYRIGDEGGSFFLYRPTLGIRLGFTSGVQLCAVNQSRVEGRKIIIFNFYWTMGESSQSTFTISWLIFQLD